MKVDRLTVVSGALLTSYWSRVGQWRGHGTPTLDPGVKESLRLYGLHCSFFGQGTVIKSVSQPGARRPPGLWRFSGNIYGNIIVLTS